MQQPRLQNDKKAIQETKRMQKTEMDDADADAKVQPTVEREKKLWPYQKMRRSTETLEGMLHYANKHVNNNADVCIESLIVRAEADRNDTGAYVNYANLLNLHLAEQSPLATSTCAILLALILLDVAKGKTKYLDWLKLFSPVEASKKELGDPVLYKKRYPQKDTVSALRAGKEAIEAAQRDHPQDQIRQAYCGFFAYLKAGYSEFSKVFHVVWIAYSLMTPTDSEVSEELEFIEAGEHVEEEPQSCIQSLINRAEASRTIRCRLEVISLSIEDGDQAEIPMMISIVLEQLLSMDVPQDLTWIKLFSPKERSYRDLQRSCYYLKRFPYKDTANVFRRGQAAINAAEKEYPGNKLRQACYVFFKCLLTGHSECAVNAFSSCSLACSIALIPTSASRSELFETDEYFKANTNACIQSLINRARGDPKDIGHDMVGVLRKIVNADERASSGCNDLLIGLLRQIPEDLEWIKLFSPEEYVGEDPWNNQLKRYRYGEFSCIVEEAAKAIETARVEDPDNELRHACCAFFAFLLAAYKAPKLYYNGLGSRGL